MSRNIQVIPPQSQQILTLQCKDSSIRLIHGDARCFGSSLTSDILYLLPSEQSFPIRSTEGCSIEVIGTSKWSESTNIVLNTMDQHKSPYFLNSNIPDEQLHNIIELYRAKVLINQKSSPCILIIGETNTCKSSICRSLVNLPFQKKTHRECTSLNNLVDSDIKASEDDVKSTESRGVTLVDLDIGQSLSSCPGTLSASFIRNPIGIYSQISDLSEQLLLFYGSLTLKGKLDLIHFNYLLQVMNTCIDNMNLSHHEFKMGGTIINTMGWINGLGLECIKSVIYTFPITHIVITNNNQVLGNNIIDYLKSTDKIGSIDIIYFPSIPNVLIKSRDYCKYYRNNKFMQYFIGTVERPLKCFRKLFEIKSLMFVSAIHLKPLNKFPIQPRTICAISSAHKLEKVKSANMIGFVIILEMGNKEVSLLLPSCELLPSHIIIVSDIILPPEFIPQY